MENFIPDIISEHIDFISEPGILSYSRCYYWWKKYKILTQLFKEEIEKKDSKIKILDAGCGLGKLIFDLGLTFGKDKELEFSGVDFNPLRLGICKFKKDKHREVNANFYIGSIFNLAFPPNSFDIIFSIEVIEHLKDYEKAVNEFYRVLKPGGMVIITTPNKSNLISSIKNIFHKTKSGETTEEELIEDRKQRKYGYGHITIKGLDEWIEIFKKSNFKVDKIKRGSLLWGNSRQDNRRFFFSIIILLEIIFDKLNIFNNLTEDVIISFRK